MSKGMLKSLETKDLKVKCHWCGLIVGEIEDKFVGGSLIRSPHFSIRLEGKLECPRCKNLWIENQKISTTEGWIDF